MRIEWLNKKGSDRVIVFFHGWGMDAASVSHLQIEDDVLMCYDYRSLDFAFPDLGYYRCICGRLVDGSVGRRSGNLQA